MPKKTKPAPARSAASSARRKPGPAKPTVRLLPIAPVAGAVTRARASRGLIVVGVGASAGGLEAFSQMLRAMGDTSQIAIVFVQHLSPHHESALVPLLAVQTALSVVQVTEGMQVEAGRVYVIPPNMQMEMRGNELHLSPRPESGMRYLPIDAFFMSLAESAQERSVAVVL